MCLHLIFSLLNSDVFCLEQSDTSSLSRISSCHFQEPHCPSYSFIHFNNLNLICLTCSCDTSAASLHPLSLWFSGFLFQFRATKFWILIHIKVIWPLKLKTVLYLHCNVARKHHSHELLRSRLWFNFQRKQLRMNHQICFSSNPHVMILLGTCWIGQRCNVTLLLRVFGSVQLQLAAHVWSLSHLLVTAWRSFISDLSNQTWGQERTIDLCMIPISPPWIWPTWRQQGSQSSDVTVRDTLTRCADDTHHSVAAIIGQNHNIDRSGVIRYTYSSFLWSVFSGDKDMALC